MEGNRQKTDILTAREFEVLKLLAKGYTTEKISLMLGLTPWTVKKCRKELQEKFNAKNASALVYKAVKANLI